MPGGLWSIGSHNSILTSGSQRALGMQHSGDSRPRKPAKICPGLSEGQEPGRTPRGVTLDTTDPKNLSQLALPPNSVPAKRGLAGGSQVMLFFLRVKLKILARVAWREGKAVPSLSSSDTGTHP